MRSRDTTLIAAGPGYLGTRFESTVPPVPWKNELSVVVKNAEGEERSLNDGDYHHHDAGKLAASETVKSDGASSIFLVPDHGFVAAAKLFVRAETPGSEQILGINDLRVHLDLEPGAEGCTAVESVAEKLEASLVTSMMDTRRERYLPVDRLYSILDSRTILSLMRELFPDATYQDLCAKVTDIIGTRHGILEGKCRRRILAILVYCEHLKPSALKAFIDCQVWDQDLPLRRRGSSSGESSPHCSTKTHPDVINTTLLKGWKRNQLTLFYAHQPKFHVPFFDLREDRLCSYEFESTVTLPWQSLEWVADGGGGTVYRIEIHPSHHNYGAYSRKPVAFALKKINSPEGESYKRELLAHEKTCAKLQKGEHIIKLLLTYEYDGHHYLLFEWADGPLDVFWDKRTAKGPPEADLWAAKQCFGLATALKQIHGLATWQEEKRKAAKKNRDLSLGISAAKDDKGADWGRHGDIKPKNILWFSKYRDRKDHLVISDLGLTRYHSEFSRSQMSASKVDGFSEAYRPPEMDLDKPISRKSDVWSLGCVFLEFCIWYLEGADGVAKFEHEREEDDKSAIRGLRELKFFIIESANGSREKTATVKPVITEWFAKAHTLPSQFVQQMLGIIEKKMLKIEPDARAQIDMISIDILTIVDKLKKEAETDGLMPPSPTIPTAISDDFPLDIEPSQTSWVTEVESDVKYAKGNSDSPDTEGQFHQAMQRPPALSIRTMASDLSADNSGSRSNPHTAGDDRSEDEGNDTAAETRPDGHGVISLLSHDSMCESASEPPPTQTPFTTMDNSQVLEGAAPSGRAGQINLVLDALESISQSPSNTAVPDGGAGSPETPQREEKLSSVETTPRQPSECPVVPQKDDIPSAALLQVTEIEERQASVSTTQAAETAGTVEVLEKRSVFRSLKNLNMTATTSGTEKVYRRVRTFLKEEVIVKIRKK